MFQEFHHQTQGRGHVAEGVPCQDRTAYRSRDGIQVLCLADGAGSAARSESGARALVDEGCKLLLENFTEYDARDDGAQVKLEIVHRLLSRLERTSKRQKCDVKDLAATFLAVATHGDRFIAVHVGDGVIGYVWNGQVKVISAPDNDEFVNQTTFLTSHSAAGSMRLLRGGLEDVSGFVLMSDGPANSLFDHRVQQLASACSKMVTLVGETPSAGQKKMPGYRWQLRRLLETTVRNATKDDCSLGVFGRPVPVLGDA